LFLVYRSATRGSVAESFIGGLPRKPRPAAGAAFGGRQTTKLWRDANVVTAAERQAGQSDPRRSSCAAYVPRPCSDRGILMGPGGSIEAQIQQNSCWIGINAPRSQCGGQGFDPPRLDLSPQRSLPLTRGRGALPTKDQLGLLSVSPRSTRSTGRLVDPRIDEESPGHPAVVVGCIVVVTPGQRL
jgi:hypothetical protein